MLTHTAPSGGAMMDALNSMFNGWLGMGPVVPPRHPPGSLAATASVAFNKFARFENTPRPSPLSSLLARFSTRPILPSFASPTYRAFAEARCEVESQEQWVPLSLAIGEDALAILGVGGMKQTDPALTLVRLDDPPKEDRYSSWGIDVPIGISRRSSNLALDESRRRVFVADSWRIKSYRWAKTGEESLPRHTLSSIGYGGQLVLREGGSKLLRLGTGGLAVWNLAEQPTHGPKGKSTIGGKYGEYDDPVLSDRFDEENLEYSKGSPPSMTVKGTVMADIQHWRDHPSKPNEALVTHRKRWTVSGIDIVTQQIVRHYVGHGGEVSGIITSPDDPHSFLTTSYDGCVKFYDSRAPAPSLAILHNEESVKSALYELFDGQPYVIIGGTGSQQVKVWDVRARAPLYELSTGNNVVNALAWDRKRQTLYAATDCPWMDRIGYHHGYRPARFRTEEQENQARDAKRKKREEARKKRREERLKEPVKEPDDSDDEGNWEDEQDSDDDSYSDSYSESESEESEGDPEDRRCWPEDAWHFETSFGHPLDCGYPRMFRYKFRPDPDVTKLPEYGDGRITDPDDPYGMMF
ncbi:hypothetical protein FA95DRAFT_792933 [Auriscalpium vulgare]|uniref:Uncharacterized protein n=1 Tax=Auriscalpium vulgare TaxID=40419 RepID=A0ACB8RAB0_9AGAM|nr:hypothetical protein FA95DRAFT_792933 [Auriscalpium vulgare]